MAKEIQIVVSAKAGSFAGFDDARARIKQLQEQGGKSGGGEKGALGRLNDLSGRSSEFGHLIHALEGGGAVFALAKAGQVFGELTAKAAELSKQIESGAISAREMGGELARSIPVLGDFIKGFDNILGAITGEAEETARLTAEGQQLNDTYEAGNRLLKWRVKTEIDHAEQMAKLQEQVNAIGLTGPAARHASIDSEYQAETKAILQKYTEDEAAINAMHGDHKADLQQRLAQGVDEFNLAGQKRDKAHSEVDSEWVTQRNAEDDQENADLARRKREGELASARLGGRGTQQELANNAADFDARKTAIEAARDREIMDRHKAGIDTTGIKERAEKEVQIEFDAAAQKREEIRHRASMEGEDAQSRIRQGRIAAIDEELSAGQRLNELEKQRLEIQEKYAARRRELNELLRTADVEQRPAIHKALSGLNAEEKRSQETAAEGAVRNATLDIAREEASGGNSAAKWELARLETAKKYADIQAQLQGAAKDPNATAAQKARADAMLKGLPDEARRAVAGAVRNATLDIAREEASGGNSAAKRELARLETAEKYADIQAQLQGAAKDPNATAAQKARADAMLKGLPDEARRAVAGAGQDHAPLPATAEFHQGGPGNHGLAAKAREEAFLAMARAQNHASVATDAIRGLLANLLQRIGTPQTF